MVTFTLVHGGKYKTEDNLKIQTIKKLNTTKKKQTTQNTAKQNYPTDCNIRPENEVGLFYTTLPSQTQGEWRIGLMGTDWGYRQSTLRN